MVGICWDANHWRSPREIGGSFDQVRAVVGRFFPRAFEREEAVQEVWLQVHRGRKSVVLDLKEPAGRQILLELVRPVDIGSRGRGENLDAVAARDHPLGERSRVLLGTTRDSLAVALPDAETPSH